MRRTPHRVLCAAALLLAALTGCGGGGGGGGGGGPPPALNITSGTVADGVVGANYNQTVAVTGGTGARVFAVSAGALPAGLTLAAATGAISGTAAGPAGTANFSITVTDSATPAQTDTQALTLRINDPLVITTATLPGTTIGAAYNQTLASTGGTAPYSYAVSAGMLPAGLSLSGDGSITGTATAAATNQSFTLRSTDNSSPPQSVTRAYAIPVTLEITTVSLPQAVAGQFYSATLQAQGGQPPYTTWTRTAGSMPAGISDPMAGGVVSGTPSPVCTGTMSTFSVQLADSAVPPATDTQANISLLVSPAGLTIVNVGLPSGRVGSPYLATVQAAGGTPPYTFTTIGTLPSQLGPIHPTNGTISGTPDTIEARTFDVIVTDSCGAVHRRTFTIIINSAVAGRNDTIASATPLTNGVFPASISPSGHPNTVFDADEDYYRITTTQAATVVVDIDAQVNGSPLDSVIEAVDANGVRLNTCTQPGVNQPCVHDDEVLGVELDSILFVQVSGPTTFYVRVVDWRGDARPDLFYTIEISGVN